MIFKNMFRVIILKVDVQICRERLLNCRHNVTENEHNRHYLASCESLGIDPDYKLNVCFKDYKDIVEQDVILSRSLFKYFVIFKFIQIFRVCVLILMFKIQKTSNLSLKNLLKGKILYTNF